MQTHADPSIGKGTPVDKNGPATVTTANHRRKQVRWILFLKDGGRASSRCYH
ncbi:MAG: hypothetical protein ACLRZG_03595 [Streptococcus sp.]